MACLNIIMTKVYFRPTSPVVYINIALYHASIHLLVGICMGLFILVFIYHTPCEIKDCGPQGAL